MVDTDAGQAGSHDLGNWRVRFPTQKHQVGIPPRCNPSCSVSHPLSVHLPDSRDLANLRQLTAYIPHKLNNLSYWQFLKTLRCGSVKWQPGKCCGLRNVAKGHSWLLANLE